VVFPLYETNGLWYYNNDDYCDNLPMITCNYANLGATVQQMTKRGLYELIHAQMGHPGETVMAQLHRHVDGVTKLSKPQLFRCRMCLLAKVTKQVVTKQNIQNAILLHSTRDTDTEDGDLDSGADIQYDSKAGTHFHMDMGFVRGTKYNIKDEDGHIKTSLDGNNSYLIIVDRAMRYTWAFLSRY
jgi:hypothetical protein